MRLEYPQANALLATAQRILVLTHALPDGDAIGSMRGLAFALANQGKSVICAVDEGTPENLAFLPGAADVLPNLNTPPAVDLVIVTDCSDERRIGKVGQVAKSLGLPLINLDHHRTNTMFGVANIVDPDTASASEGVLDWLEVLGFAVTAEAAQCLLCGLITDTMCFRTNSTTAKTLERAMHLMRAGADLNGIVQRTVNRIPTSAIQLWAKVMPTVQIRDHVIWATISLEAAQEVGADGKSGNLVSLLLQADDAYISCVLRELPDGIISAGLRAKPGFDIATVAVALGGGGHTLAAGAEIACSLNEAEARVLPMLWAAATEGTLLYV
jgi:bifunctional oligoribonuclease and PAP phosphatase NrnA